MTSYCGVSNVTDLNQFHLICQMLANFLGWNLKGPFVKKIWASFTYSTLHALSFAEAVSCRNRVKMVKKYTKKSDARAELSFCHNKPIAFFAVLVAVAVVVA